MMIMDYDDGLWWLWLMMMMEANESWWWIIMMDDAEIYKLDDDLDGWRW